MKIAMLARNPNLYSHKRLVEAAEAKGHRIDIVNTIQCYANITSQRPQVLYRGAALTGYDAVIPRHRCIDYFLRGSRCCASSR